MVFAVQYSQGGNCILYFHKSVYICVEKTAKFAFSN